MRPLALLSAPKAAPDFHRFQSVLGEHVFLVPESRIFDLVGAANTSPEELAELVSSFIGATAADRLKSESQDAVVMPSPQSISLNVSSSCNHSCGYCYAAQGNFGAAQPEAMTLETARAAVDALLRSANPAAPVTVGFIGGEPFMSRHLIHDVVRHATSEAYALGLDVRFSVTTNATLLREEDLQLLRDNRFAVTVSIDGDQQTHERRRPLLVGRGGSYSRLREAIEPLLREPGRAQVAARATVTRFDLDVARAYDSILGLGFAEVGFAPLKSGRIESGVFADGDWGAYSDSLVGLAKRELKAAVQGASLRLTNFAVALKQLHRGACSPYPCGAGGGYFSVAAGGDWYTCHRAIGEDSFRVGTNDGLDVDRRAAFLLDRHVHAQTDCHGCWARYLCSGGCHQESAHRTASSCDFVRGWLDFCLSAYAELSEAQPMFFNAAGSVTPSAEQRQ